ncbi:MAG: type IV toxin-antitoxin system AbiEi family antitoxin domain-containing protein [Kiritimatiellae bacterium]|jgi:predicted transcriptional regulator of viral defense system|nr:type IV toxin-antitoxin system AbiEi family antitoxin domain-containing protein [Kiritimatiellia bacterium]
MSLFDVAYSISTENHGILTAFEARENGISSKDIARWVKIGRFIKLGNGVYKSTQYPSSEEDPYAIAVAQAGRGAYLSGESVLGFLRLMPTNVDSIYIKIPRRLRRCLPEGYVASVDKREYKPVNINGVLCQRPVDAIRQCIGIHMRERLLQASENAYKLGYMDKSDLDHLSKELSNA